MRRPDLDTARRVVVKIGSSSLATGGEVDPTKIVAVAETISELADRRQVVVVSSGAIASGIRPLGFTTRPRDVASLQAAASVGQGILLAHYAAALAPRQVGQVLLSADDLSRRSHHRNAARTISRLLDLGVLPIVNENDTVATNEIRLGDNDRLAALVAHLVEADLLLLLSDVDAVYDRPPARRGAIALRTVNSQRDLDKCTIDTKGGGVGTGGMATKVDAAQIAASAGIGTLVTDQPSVLAALTGAPLGTYFVPTGKRPRTRLFWLRHLSEASGRLELDAGAVRAVIAARRSLLAPGILSVSGTFRAGDPVDLVDPVGSVFARGFVAYDSDELPTLIGSHTRVEQRPSREVVHRDDLVLLHQ